MQEHGKITGEGEIPRKEKPLTAGWTLSSVLRTVVYGKSQPELIRI
jgi:hypothetical protein